MVELKAMQTWARALVSVALVLIYSACSKDNAARYITDTVTKGTVSDSISATGDVSALVKVNVGSQVSGTIAKLHVDFNTKVKKGDLLAELDPRLLLAQLQRTEAAVAVAEADVEKSKVALLDGERNARRMRELAAKKMVSQSDLDTADVTAAAAAAAVKGAEAGLLQARADRDSAETNLTFTKIRSPIEGTVIDRQVDVGQTVAAQFQVATLFVIANDLRHVQVLANVDEADVGKLHAKMPAQFRVDAFPSDVFNGTIREVRQAPTSATASSSGSGSSTTTTTSNVVTYAAVVDAENPDYKLRQGMTAQVSVLVAERKDVLVVPNAALRFRPKSGDDDAPAPTEHGQHLYRLDNNKPVRVAVKAGLADGRRVEILEGVAEGDTVILGEMTGGAQKPPKGFRRGPL